MFADVVGFSRMAGADEARTVAKVRTLLDELARLVEAESGRIVSTRGDGALVAFRNPSAAVECALSFQRYITKLSADDVEDRAIHCRVGIHYGAVVEAANSLFGDAVNIAARLEQTAEPGMILISEAVRSGARRLRGMEDMGFLQLKGISAPVRVWRLAPSKVVPNARASTPTASTPDVLGGGRPTIAVLTFEHPPDGDQAYLAEGIAEDVIAALTKFKWLFVLSPRSSLNYKTLNADLKQIRADLGVHYALHGKLACSGGRLRLSVSLSDCIAADTIWSHRFDGSMTDVFRIQDEITATIVGALEPAVLRREEQEAVRPAPRSLKHWDLFIRGRWHFWQLTYRSVAKAHEILNQALALKPDDPPTLSLLAMTHFTQIWADWTDDPDRSLAQARRLAVRAVRLDPEDAFAHYTLGIAMAITGDLDRAMAEQQRALELNPNFAGAMAEMGRYRAFSGEYQAAIDLLDRAIRASPGDAHLFLWFRDKAIAAFTTRRYDAAVAFAREAVARRPHIFFNHYLLAASLAARGDVELARQSFAEGRQQLPRYSLQALKLGHPFKRSEDLDRYVDALKISGWEG